jgi:hypothetical protein
MSGIIAALEKDLQDAEADADSVTSDAGKIAQSLAGINSTIAILQEDVAYFRDKVEEAEDEGLKRLGVALVGSGAVVYLNSNDRLFVTLGAVMAVAGLACLI